jgi:hypothetical protein
MPPARKGVRSIPDFQFDSQPFFYHNLCFRCPNGSFEPILNIYVSIVFQWYNKFFKAMGFDPCNRSLKIRKSIETPTPILGVHLRVWGFIFTLSHTLPHSRTPLLVRILASPCLGREPKARVVTYNIKGDRLQMELEWKQTFYNFEST